MAKVTLFNQTGENVGDIELNDAVFGIEPNEQAVYDVVKAQRAAMRQGTHSTKNRSAVRGGGRKPWRQKGTGRARVGTNRSPLWTGGGIVFGPSPRKYILKVNKKVRRLALKSVLSSKLQEENFKVLDQLTLEQIKTKDMVNVLNNLKVEGKVAFVLDKPNTTLALAARNIPGVTVTTVDHVSVYELLNVKTVVLTADAVKKYEEVLG
ncbi:50S ribosomal protein L4 [Candidatus Xianfuyuplasma coldseepsis]|uniref:Large ribosomal subunit protein uL4 n=1 Tax=Candidatus Xianfuyuplasma coldseepsis TaxID=2782163 RepID=A0A7L7KQT8_9MOLU|nr:50S ribosomal protein L4 [Xianfuyuplasma coldseepsis]QMS85180.1 50S ribosomal protein L4 [Xianfuyuplasma coldseepsis]